MMLPSLRWSPRCGRPVLQRHRISPGETKNEADSKYPQAKPGGIPFLLVPASMVGDGVRFRIVKSDVLGQE